MPPRKRPKTSDEASSFSESMMTRASSLSTPSKSTLTKETPQLHQHSATVNALLHRTQGLSDAELGQMLLGLAPEHQQRAKSRSQSDLEILDDFLSETKIRVEHDLNKLQMKLNWINRDQELVTELMKRAQPEIIAIKQIVEATSDDMDQDEDEVEQQPSVSKLEETSSTSRKNSGNQGGILERLKLAAASALPKVDDDNDDIGSTHGISNRKASDERRREKVLKHRTDLEHQYFEKHEKLADGKQAFDEFRHSLASFTRYTSLSKYYDVRFAPASGQPNVISSIEFDSTQEYFATAGVTNDIKIYRFASVVSTLGIDAHPPICSIPAKTKISCLSWNPYFIRSIACTDYTGLVQVWDTDTGERKCSFEEHNKRAWSVDFSTTDPYILASGSDDHNVKLWSTRGSRSIATIPCSANVCCVQFCPSNSNLLAFGASDHHVHIYDLRDTKKELHCFKGHSKAVSYVKFISETQAVSASTDSTLRLWDLQKQQCERVYKGHVNEKNFVGLTVNGDYMACGSEDNSVYVYYKGLTQPITKYTFPTTTKSDRVFVSSVCWKKHSDIIVAANNQGNINMLKLD